MIVGFDPDLPLSEQDMRVISVGVFTVGAHNPVVNGALNRLAIAFEEAHNSGATSVVIPLDSEDIPMYEVVATIALGEKNA